MLPLPINLVLELILQLLHQPIHSSVLVSASLVDQSPTLIEVPRTCLNLWGWIICIMHMHNIIQWFRNVCNQDISNDPLNHLLAPLTRSRPQILSNFQGVINLSKIYSHPALIISPPPPPPPPGVSQPPTSTMFTGASAAAGANAGALWGKPTSPAAFGSFLADQSFKPAHIGLEEWLLHWVEWLWHWVEWLPLGWMTETLGRMKSCDIG